MTAIGWPVVVWLPSTSSALLISDGSCSSSGVEAPPPSPAPDGGRGGRWDASRAGRNLHGFRRQIRQGDRRRVDRARLPRTPALRDGDDRVGSSGSCRSFSTWRAESVAELVLQLTQEQRVLRLLAAAPP